MANEAAAREAAELKRPANKKRKHAKAVSSSRLSFDTEELEGSPSLPRCSLSDLTAARFKDEDQAAARALKEARRRHLRDPPSPPPSDVALAQNMAASLQWGPETSAAELPPPLVLVGVATARGGRPYMEDRHVHIQDLGSIEPRLSGTRCVTTLDLLDGLRQ